MVEGGNQQAAVDLTKFQQNLDDTRMTIAELRKFFATLRKDLLPLTATREMCAASWTRRSSCRA